MATAAVVSLNSPFHRQPPRGPFNADLSGSKVLRRVQHGAWGLVSEAEKPYLDRLSCRWEKNLTTYTKGCVIWRVPAIDTAPICLNQIRSRGPTRLETKDTWRRSFGLRRVSSPPREPFSPKTSSFYLFRCKTQLFRVKALLKFARPCVFLLENRSPSFACIADRSAAARRYKISPQHLHNSVSVRAWNNVYRPCLANSSNG